MARPEFFRQEGKKQQELPDDTTQKGRVVGAEHLLYAMHLIGIYTAALFLRFYKKDIFIYLSTQPPTPFYR